MDYRTFNRAIRRGGSAQLASVLRLYELRLAVRRHRRKYHRSVPGREWISTRGGFRLSLRIAVAVIRASLVQCLRCDSLRVPGRDGSCEYRDGVWAGEIRRKPGSLVDRDRIYRRRAPDCSQT